MFQRINRLLAKKGQCLRAWRRGRSGTPGDLYVVDLNRNVLVTPHADLEYLGRVHGVLQEFEALEPIDEYALSDARDVEREERRTRRRR